MIKNKDCIINSFVEAGKTVHIERASSGELYMMSERLLSF